MWAQVLSLLTTLSILSDTLVDSRTVSHNPNQKESHPSKSLRSKILSGRKTSHQFSNEIIHPTLIQFLLAGINLWTSQSASRRANVPYWEGMIVSLEPGEWYSKVPEWAHQSGTWAQEEESQNLIKCSTWPQTVHGVSHLIQKVFSGRKDSRSSGTVIMISITSGQLLGIRTTGQECFNPSLYLNRLSRWILWWSNMRIWFKLIRKQCKSKRGFSQRRS